MKTYLYMAGVAGLAVVFVAYTYFVYDKGRDAEKARMAIKIEEYRESQRFLLEKLGEEQAKERIVYKTKVRTIRETVDPSECLDTPLPAAVLDQLR